MGLLFCLPLNSHLYMSKKLGWKPSPTIVLPTQKFSNFLQSPASNQITGAQNLIDWRGFCSPVEDQADIGSCVANAIVSNLEFLEIKQGLPYTDLSRMFVYYNSRLETNTANLDEGSDISSAFDAIKRYGVCSEQTWPYDPDKVFMRASWMSYREGYLHSIKNSYKIEASGEARHQDILKCLKSCHPVVFGVKVFSSFRGVDGNVPMPKSDENLLGGHSMLIVGVDLINKKYLIRNSWGKYWSPSESGYAWMSFDYIEKYGSYDFWTCTKI